MTAQTAVTHDQSFTYTQPKSARLLQRGHHYYYCSGQAVLAISQAEYQQVADNPQLYYFSTALKLQQRAQRLTQVQQLLVDALPGEQPSPQATLPHKYTLSQDDIDYEIVRLRIRQNKADPHLRQEDLDLLQHNNSDYAYPHSAEHNYWAEVIRAANGFYYYRIGDTVVDISKDDYCRVIQNPILYHISTALYLHRRIARINAIKNGL